MACILCIETSTQVCSVALFNNHTLLGLKESTEKNAHSAILTSMISGLMHDFSLDYKDLDAIAVSEGPGSYTGLRIGVSVAKGLCYAVSKPLLAVNTLQCIASGVTETLVFENDPDKTDVHIIPMIDARRMEVYDAVFNLQNEMMSPVKAEIITEHAFENLPGRIILCGDGAEKCKEALRNNNRIEFMTSIVASAGRMGNAAYSKFEKGLFADLAYFEPFYLKDFIAGAPRVKGLN